MSDAASSLSVIICTRNRSRELATCLTQLVKQAKQARETVEVMVVDNASTDDTAATVSAMSEDLAFPIKYVYESKIGLCTARNTARREANSDYIAYIDDDAVPHQNWISTILRTFDEHKMICIGGRIIFVPEGGVPHWFPRELFWVVGEVDHGTEFRKMNAKDELPPGGNFAIPVAIFDAANGFDERIAIYGDDEDFFRRVSKLGFDFYYVPEMIIDHCPRIERKELLTKAYKWGQGRAILNALHREGSGNRFYVGLKNLAIASLIGLCWIPTQTFYRAFGFWLHLGAFTQSFFGGRSVSTKRN